jgi:two-component system, chemotaxis family, chemotaxis protein CheY
MSAYSDWYDVDSPQSWPGEDEALYGASGPMAGAQPVPMPGTESSKDILVVDDDPYLCEIMTDVLETEGHEIRSASNGEEALARIRERKPHLVLLDLMMPVMNGWEVAAALRSNPEWADIPIVLITAAHGSDSQKQQATGARAVISKPFDIDQLAQVVNKHAS